MRYLILFMFLVGIFMFGKRSCHFSGFGPHGEGPVRSEIRDVRDFHAVDLNVSGDVEISVADQYSVQVRTNDNLVSLLKTEVKNGRLKIYFDENVSHSDVMEIKISGPSFDELNVAGSGNMTVMTPIQSERMDVAISGSGNLSMPQVTFGTLECSISGSGNMEIGGTANATQVSVSGSGDVDAKKLRTNELRADIAGSGSVSAHVIQVLKVSVAGSGDVYYTGEPSVESSVSGSGTVKKM